MNPEQNHRVRALMAEITGNQQRMNAAIRLGHGDKVGALARQIAKCAAEIEATVITDGTATLGSLR